LWLGAVYTPLSFCSGCVSVCFFVSGLARVLARHRMGQNNALGFVLAVLVQVGFWLVH
jgi:hypothetical protein